MSETDSKPRIAIGSDHAGFPVKEAIRKYLETAGYPVDDKGTWSEESVDHPDYGKAVGELSFKTSRSWHRYLRLRHRDFHRRQQSLWLSRCPGP